MDTHALLDGLGGNKMVADALGIGATAVGNWRLRGEVPARFHLPLWRMAIDAGLDWQPPGAEGLREALCPVPPQPSIPEVQAQLDALHGEAA